MKRWKVEIVNQLTDAMKVREVTAANAGDARHIASRGLTGCDYVDYVEELD